MSVASVTIIRHVKIGVLQDTARATTTSQPTNMWNRIEITYEEEGGKCFLSFSVNGRNSNKKSCDQFLPNSVTNFASFIHTLHFGAD